MSASKQQDFQEHPQLETLPNPFFFPSETDNRFLLLTLIVAGSSFTVSSFTLNFWSAGALAQLAVGTAVTIIIFGLSWIRAKGFGRRKIKREAWLPFPPPTDNEDKRASLQRMAAQIQQIVQTLPDIGPRPPQFIWDENSSYRSLPVGVAFGFGKQQYVGLREGVHAAFLEPASSNKFEAVLLHELGHIGNRDVSKTIFSIVLAQTFYLIMIGVLLVFNLTFLIKAIRLIGQNELGLLWEAAKVVVGIDVRLLLVFFLVEYARSSILRVREYYADYWARAMVGASAPFIELLTTADADNVVAAQPDLPIFSRLRQQWSTVRSRLLPVHPERLQRIAALKNREHLFDLKYEMAFLASLLGGLSLNANAYLVTSAFGITDYLRQLNDLIQLNNDNVTLLAGGLLFLLVESVVWLLIGLVFLGFVLWPIAGTVGTDLQKSAISASAATGQDRWRLWVRLIRIAAVMGCGVVVGGWLAPIPNFLSLPGWLILLAPVMVVGWTAVFFLWLTPVFWFSRRLFQAHAGNKPPVLKRGIVSALATALLLPLFFPMAMLQMFIGVLIAFTDEYLASIGLITATALGLFLIGFLLQAGAWITIWGICKLLGWLSIPTCPRCQHVGQPGKSTVLTARCANCGHLLAQWLWYSPSVRLPSRQPPRRDYPPEPPPLTM